MGPVLRSRLTDHESTDPESVAECGARAVGTGTRKELNFSDEIVTQVSSLGKVP